MSPQTIALSSVTRITDFAENPPDFAPQPRDTWARGDYVLAEMLPGQIETYPVEGAAGRAIDIRPGDRLVGVLGDRAATLEVVGGWRHIGDDLRMQTLTVAGVLGVATSASTLSRPLAPLRYVGHAVRDGRALTMKDFVVPVPVRSVSAPVILIIGTSMNSGKTVSAVAMIRQLTALGRRVVGAKVTGVGRYRDTLAMRDAGAAAIFDFVDVGLPSTLVPAQEYEQDLRLLCARIAAAEPDVVVIEAGASPLEPYCGDVALRMLHPKVALTVLCASDPYAVWGIMHAFNLRPDVVSGPCTSTEAGIALIDRMTGVPAINMFDPATGPALSRFLQEHLPA